MTDNGEDFEKLRRLLALKRHEQPPPGYFNRLPDRITSRIEMEQAAEYSGWWAWLVARFDARPLLACTCGVAISGLLLTGFQISQTLQAESNTGFTQSGPWLANVGYPSPNRPALSLQAPFGISVEAMPASSINPVFEPIAPNSPYQMAGYGIQRVSWGGTR